MTVCVYVYVCARMHACKCTQESEQQASIHHDEANSIFQFLHPSEAGSAPPVGGVYFLATCNVQGSPAYLPRHLAHSLPGRLCDAMLILLPQMKMSSQLLQMPLTADPSLEEKTAVVQPLTSEAPSGTMAEEEFCRFPAGQGCPDRARQ